MLSPYARCCFYMFKPWPCVHDVGTGSTAHLCPEYRAHRRVLRVRCHRRGLHNKKVKIGMKKRAFEISSTLVTGVTGASSWTGSAWCAVFACISGRSRWALWSGLKGLSVTNENNQVRERSAHTSPLGPLTPVCVVASSPGGPGGP